MPVPSTMAQAPTFPLNFGLPEDGGSIFLGASSNSPAAPHNIPYMQSMSNVDSHHHGVGRSDGGGGMTFQTQQQEMSTTTTTTTTPMKDEYRSGGTTTTRKRKSHTLSSRLSSDPASIQKLQKLLLLLRHASKCPNDNLVVRGAHSSEGCPVAHCNSMKKLWRHISRCKCKTGGSRHTDCRRSCSFPHCDRSRFALWHYKYCSDGHSCPVCGPVKAMIATENARRSSQQHNGDYQHQKPMADEESPCKRLRTSEPSSSRSSLPPVFEENIMDGPVVFHETNIMDVQTLSKCTKLLQELLNHPNGWVFSSPVDPVLLGVPDYFDVVKQPMDLGTIDKRLKNKHYNDVNGFRTNVLLTFDNAILFNMKGTEVYSMAVDLKDRFVAQFETVFG